MRSLYLIVGYPLWNLKTEFANLSHVKRKNIEDNICHTDLRESFTSNLFLVISRSWPISGADMGYWDVWQTCHLRVRNIWTHWIMIFYKFLTLKKMKINCWSRWWKVLMPLFSCLPNFLSSADLRLNFRLIYIYCWILIKGEKSSFSWILWYSCAYFH